MRNIRNLPECFEGASWYFGWKILQERRKDGWKDGGILLFVSASYSSGNFSHTFQIFLGHSLGGRQVKRRHTPEPCQNMLLKVSGLEKACLEDAQLPSDFQRPPSASLDSLALSVDLRAFGVGKGVRACETRTEFRVPAPFFSTFSIFVPLGTGSIH